MDADTGSSHLAEYLATLSDAALSDIAAGKWDDVMTDHLYAAMGCDTPEEMQDMRRKAQEAAKLIVITRLHANVRQALGL
jgi:NAD(P)H-dependent FMN reductase